MEVNLINIVTSLWYLGVNFVNKWNKSELFGGLLSNFWSIYVNA